MDKPILFFDGHCNLCNGLVNFVMRFNKGHFYVASIQGNTAKSILTEKEINNLNTIVFFDNDKKFYKSRALFRLFWRIGGLMRFFSFFQILPLFFTDFIYEFVAKNRYKWFGKKEICRLPTKAEKALFLD